jgi:hypothetical protein
MMGIQNPRGPVGDEKNEKSACNSEEKEENVKIALTRGALELLPREGGSRLLTRSVGRRSTFGSCGWSFLTRME